MEQMCQQPLVELVARIEWGRFETDDAGGRRDVMLVLEERLGNVVGHVEVDSAC